MQVSYRKSPSYRDPIRCLLFPTIEFIVNRNCVKYVLKFTLFQHKNKTLCYILEIVSGWIRVLKS